MQTPPKPSGEAHRLQILKDLNILDTESEERFDRITRTAARLFEVPIALVSLVDECRQWFKSRQGLDAEETAREISFCAHAILGTGVFVVEDAREDARFQDNPLVTGVPYIRFYAGCPLKGPEGATLGTLCLIDRHPRTFSAGDQAALGDLAAWAERELNQIPLAKALSATKEAEDRLKALLWAIPDEIFRLTKEGINLDVQVSNPEVLMVPAQEFIGKGMADILPKEVAEARMRSLRQALETGEIQINEYSLINKNKLRDYEARTVPVSADEVITIVRDVTEKKRAGQAKRDFISMVSHELRTPLTSIRGSLGLLHGGVMGPLPDKVNEFVAIAQHNAERMVRLVNEILDIDKIESGKASFHSAPCQLGPLMLQAMESVKGFAQSMGTQVIIDAPSDAAVETDADRLIQVFVNLLANAVKYSPHGEAVRFRARKNDNAWRIEVEDRGPGVPVEFQPAVFEKFARADPTDPRQPSGSGLGLSISKALVEGMGGSIGFQSEPGCTIFFVDLPEGNPEPRDLGSGKPRVLVVEDEPLSARVLEATLAREGFAVDRAASAAEALDLLSTHHYEAMTLDLLLPDRHGLELLEEIRRNPETQNLRVLVASSIAAEGKEKAGVPALQVLEWIQKPLDPFRLAQAFACLHAPRGAVSHPQGTKAVVLHVEDDRDVHQILSAVLGDGAELLHAPTLAAARKILLARPLDLVILDSHLPDGRGSDLIPDVHAAGGPTLPILLFSGEEADSVLDVEVSRTLQKSTASNLDIQRVVHSLLRER